MIKQHYLKEINIAGPQQKNGANNKKEVIKIQSWLNLFAVIQPGAGTATGIDGDFGPSTEAAVKNFQKAKGLAPTGIVDAALFALLVQPMTQAFTTTSSSNNLRQLVVETATRHLNAHAFELVINKQANSGPWVRSYMDGNEGDEWYWCMGFVQTVIDQAASTLSKNFKTLMPSTYSCDIVATTGIQKKLLIKNSAIRLNPSQVKPGDVFLLQKSANDWYHTGIVTAVAGDVFETIEGNTNTDGSHNGNGVYKRTRNFRKQLIDVFSIQPLV